MGTEWLGGQVLTDLLRVDRQRTTSLKQKQYGGHPEAEILMPATNYLSGDSSALNKSCERHPTKDQQHLTKDNNT